MSHFEARLAEILKMPKRANRNPDEEPESLEPCPFCRRRNLLVERADNRIWITCCWCGARGPIAVGSKARAMNNWNSDAL